MERSYRNPYLDAFAQWLMNKEYVRREQTFRDRQLGIDFMIQTNGTAIINCRNIDQKKL